MKYLKQSWLALGLALVLLASWSGLARALETGAEQAAQELAELGLLQGTEDGFELDALIDRVQGAALFVRLLGAEEDALGNYRNHPFQDVLSPHWGSPYVGWLFVNGYARGETSNRYGTGAMEPQQFATFCLRALGYKEGEGLDFLWDEAVDTLVEQEIISGTMRNYLRTASRFTRGDAVQMAHATLFTGRMKDSELTLLEHLVHEGVLVVEISVGDEIYIAYPEGMFDAATLQALAEPLGYKAVGQAYDLDWHGVEQFYTEIRQGLRRDFDVVILPGYVAELLYYESIVGHLNIPQLIQRSEFVPQLIETDYSYAWRDNLTFAVPFAFESILSYYDFDWLIA